MAIRQVPADLRKFNSLEEFLSIEKVPEGKFCVEVNGNPIDLDYEDRGYDTTLVLLHPALSDKVTRLPMFIGRSISKNARANRLFVADPTLNMADNLFLAWFAGNKDQPNLQKDLHKIFMKVSGDKRTAYFGPSGGGFAALVFSSMHPGSLAIPVNPQTNIADYMPKRVCEWTNIAWGMSNHKDVSGIAMPPVVTNLQEVYSKPLENHVLYIQNTGDTGHMKTHWEPFKSAKHPSNAVHELLVNAGPGHVAPAESFLAEVLTNACISEDWGKMTLDIKSSALRIMPSRSTTPALKSNARTRHRDVSNLIGAGHHVFANFEQLFGSPLKTGLNSIDFDGKWFDFLYEDRGSRTTLITFGAAVPVDYEQYPTISGRHFAAELGVNFLGFADSAQGGEQSIATYWHMSTQSINAQTVIPAVISHAASRQNQLFFGSSAGGFAALNYSAQFPGSVVVAMNPRINLTHAPYTFPSFTNVVTPDLDITEAKKRIPFDMAALYSKPQGNKVVYLQNMQDENYVRHHYAHFVKSVGDRDDVRFVKGDWGNGHVVPPKSTYMGVLEAMAINAPNWFGGHDIMCSCNQYRLANLTGASDPHCVAHSTVNYWEEEERSSTH